MKHLNRFFVINCKLFIKKMVEAVKFYIFLTKI
jgi:hypothetical protein